MPQVTICADFALFPRGHTLPNRFVHGGIGFNNLVSATPFVIVDHSSSGEQGMEFGPGGVEIKFPVPVAEARLRIGTFAGPLDLTAVLTDGTRQLKTIPFTNRFDDVRVTATGITSILLTDGGNEGNLERVCILIDV